MVKISTEFIEQQRQVLLALHERLSGSDRAIDSDEPNGNDFGDLSAAVTAAENALTLVSNSNQTLNEVNAALLKIKNGTYGLCEFSGEQIGCERLEAIPWARFTIEAQTAFEKEGRGIYQSENGSPSSLFENSLSPADEEEPSEE